MGPDIYGMLFIFFARLCDVSIGTVRIILISRGYRIIAPVLGFIEIIIWLAAINTALKEISGVHSYLVYAAGFAAGNYLGMMIEAKLAIGYQSLRIITTREVSALPLQLREEGFGATVVDGKGMKGDVSIIYTLVPKKKVKEVIELINILEPKAFITIEDVNLHQSGYIARKGFPRLFGRMIGKRKI